MFFSENESVLKQEGQGSAHDKESEQILLCLIFLWELVK